MTKSSGAEPGDRRVRRTRATLQRALIGLVQDRDLARISVADVVDRADVNRSTFYDHYRDVHELAEAACGSMIDDLIGFVLALDPVRAAPSGSADPDPALTAFFTHFAEHAGLYRSLLGPAGSARVIEHVRRRTTAAAHSSGHLTAPPDPTPPNPTPADPTPPDTADPSDVPHDVPAAFVAGALIGVATDWLRRGCPRTPTEMTTLTTPLLLAVSVGAGAPPTS